MKINWRAGATSDAASLRNLEGKLSGPESGPDSSLGAVSSHPLCRLRILGHLGKGLVLEKVD